MKKKFMLIGIILLLIVPCSFPIISGDPGSEIKIFYPTDDSTIAHPDPDVNCGNDIDIAIRNEYGSSSGLANDCLIRFDISSIPAGENILSATLNLYYRYWDDNNPAGRDLNLYKIANIWNENTVTWNTQPTYASSPTTYSTVPSSYSWMSWDVTDDIQDFIDGTETNYGWKITDENYWGAPNIPTIGFRAKEYGSYIPYLEIEYKEPVITVSSPYSGDTWYQGDTNTITWTSENAGSYVDIDLYQDGYFYSDIASFEYNDGSYFWAVPSGLSSSSYYEILITDSYDSSVYGYSGFFYIGEPLADITVISPSSGVTWDVGDVNTISWTADNVGSYIDINLFQDGFPYSIIASYEYNDGSYFWTVPSGLSTSSYYEIRITDSYDSSVYDYSDSFYIDEPLESYITVSSPYSGDTWYQGDTNTITWTSENAGSYVDIDLYQDGYYHSIIALSSYNDGSYSWTVPSGLNTDSYYEILITDSYDSSVYDYSGYLSIQKSPGLNFQEWIIIIAVFMAISLVIIIVAIVVIKGNPKGLPKEYRNRDTEEKLKLNKMKEKVKRWKKEGYNVYEIEQMIKSDKER